MGALAGCGSATAKTDASTTGGSPVSKPEGASDAPLTKLVIKDVKIGTGDPVKAGDKATVIYTGKLKDGTVFDSNDKSGGNPFSFKLGAGSVIKGWDQGVVGMKKGGERELSIPAALGYGSQSQGDKIPPNSDLYFTVKLVSFVTAEEETTPTRKTIKVGTGPGVKKGDTVQIEYKLSNAEDGSIVDDTYASKPYTFQVGSSKVLPVFDMAVQAMKQGGEVELGIPAMYGPRGPSYNSIDRFEADIKLVKVTPGK